MKKMFSCIIAVCTIISIASAQYCTAPKPLTLEQKEKIIGTWEGTYTFKGETHALKVVSTMSGNKFICNIENPPLPGKETDELLFFCGGGEFHFRKFVNDLSYEFQAVPENGKMEGSLKIRRNDDKPEMGKFTLNKQI